MKLSIIIPALNEEDSIGPVLTHLQKADKTGDIEETIVVDGGSTDSTKDIAREHGARVIDSEKGRAVQMNTGARAATGDCYYFLHADSYPPRNFTSHIKAALSTNSRCGCFTLTFDDDHPLLKFYAWCTKFDFRPFRYGDQSLYVDAKLFHFIGGFKEELIVMEDNEIIKRLEQQSRFNIIQAPVTTSARKYRQNGVIRLQIIFFAVYTLYHLGISQKKLVRLYTTFIQ